MALIGRMNTLQVVKHTDFGLYLDGGADGEIRRHAEGDHRHEKGDEQGENGGDALIKLRFRPHPRYRLEGRNLHVDLPVDLKEAVLGAKLPVETVKGKLAVTVPPWSGSDKVLRLKGRGLPEKSGGEGDLYVHVRIMLPEDQRSELEALARRMAH